MGITARGAWESVKRHFRELGHDIQSEDFTVVGVGDMSGDVFGNGMLLSKQIRLLAAFDHRHIFIDPDPRITSYNVCYTNGAEMQKAAADSGREVFFPSPGLCGDNAAMLGVAADAYLTAGLGIVPVADAVATWPLDQAAPVGW